MKIQPSRVLCILFAALLLTACASAYDGAASAQSTESDFSTDVASTRITPDLPSEYGFFGASVDAHQDIAVVGEWGNAVHGPNSGAAYVYVREADSWVWKADLLPADPESGARFGHSVAIDANTILVGSIFGGSAGYRSGSVYVFEHIDGMWTQTEKIVPPPGSSELYFGSAVALFDTTAVVGASGPLGRTAFIYRKEAAGWKMSAELRPHDLPRSERFGDAVAIWGDTAVVGSWPSIEDPYGDDAASAGAVYVYEQIDGSWMERTIFKGSRSAAEQQFGFALAIDHDFIAVGAPGQHESTYVYERVETGWDLHAELQVITEESQQFGVAVALDDTTLVVGSPGSNNRAGAAYVFELSGGVWESRLRVVAPSQPPGLQLGMSVAIVEDKILMGATGDSGSELAAGAAYSYP